MAVDTLPQDHVAWADVVLPEATYLERYDELWSCGHKTPYITMREPAIDPLYQTKPAWWMVRELGLRLGLDDFFTWKTAEEYLNRRLSSIGLNLDKLREQGGVAVQPGKAYLADFEKENSSPFTTTSGKVELYSDALEKSKLDPLPKYEPTPGAARRLFPLALRAQSGAHVRAHAEHAGAERIDAGKRSMAQ